jgi:hypothetical protein
MAQEMCELCNYGSSLADCAAATNRGMISELAIGSFCAL